MEIVVHSPKYGKCVVMISPEDYPKIQGKTLYIWSTERHTTLYVRVQLPKGRCQVLHRFLTQPKCLGKIVDHVDGNGLNNTRENLRFTDSTGNNCNAKKRRGARTSKFKGVHFCASTKKWRAQIQYGKRKYSGGGHSTELEAAAKYNEMAVGLHGDLAKLNDLKEVK